MKKPQILILELVYGFLSVYRLLGSDLTNVKGTVAIESLPLSLPNSLGGSCLINQATTKSLGNVGRSW